MPQQPSTRRLLLLVPTLLLVLQAPCAEEYRPDSADAVLNNQSTEKRTESVSGDSQLTIEATEKHIADLLESSQLTVEEKVNALERLRKKTNQTPEQIFDALNKFIQAKLAETGFVLSKHNGRRNNKNASRYDKTKANEKLDELIREAYTIRKRFRSKQERLATKARHDKADSLQLLASNPAHARGFLTQKHSLTPLEVYLITYTLDHNCLPLTQEKKITELLYEKSKERSRGRRRRLPLLSPALQKDKRHLKPRTYKQTVPSDQWRSFINDLAQGHPLHVAINHGLPTEAVEGLLERGAKVGHQWKSQSLLALAPQATMPIIQCFVKFIGQHSSLQERADCYRYLLRYLPHTAFPKSLLDGLRLDRAKIQAINSEVVPGMIYGLTSKEEAERLLAATADNLNQASKKAVRKNLTKRGWASDRLKKLLNENPPSKADHKEQPMAR